MAVLTDDEKRMTDTDETFRLPALDPAALPVHPGDDDDGTAAIEVVPPPPDVSASWLADPGSVTDASGRTRFQSLELLRLLLLIPVSVKVFGLGGGLVSTVVELVLLDVSGNLLYVGHFAPMAVSAFCLCALCALCVFFDGDWLFYLAAHARLYLGFTYLFIHPVGVVAALVLARLRVFDALIPWMWAVGFLLCLLVAGVIGVIRDNVAVKRVLPGEHQI